MIITKTPFRVSFVGGGSDIKDYYQKGYGSVVSTAINKFMYVTVNKTFDHYIRVVYSKAEYAEKVADIEHNLAREALNLLGITTGGIDIVYMADDYCSQRAPLFSPADFREFVMPYLTKAVEKVHKQNKKFLLHCCGAVRPLLPMIIDAGVDMLEPIQIQAEGMEPEGLKRDFGKDLCFYGGFDLQKVLCRATPQEVSDEVKRLIDILGKDGGYILGPGHTYIQIDAHIENIVAMYETAANYK